MADFCKQCSIALFGTDTRDLANLGDGTPLKEDEGHFVICEGCGPTLVNEEGECIAPDCIEQGHKGPHSCGQGHEDLPSGGT